MGRSIILKKSTGNISLQANDKPTEIDSYASQIIKLIPTDVVGVYIAIDKMLKAQSAPNQITQWIIFSILLIITPFYLKRTDPAIDKRHILVATLSFIVWAFSLGGPFENALNLPGNQFQIISAITIMIYTLLVPLLYKPKTV